MWGISRLSTNRYTVLDVSEIWTGVDFS